MELNINKVTKQYKDKVVVNELSLTLRKGVTGLLGANGAGKTTFLRMICGTLKPTSGDIKFNGIDVSEESYRDILGYLPQEFGYYPNFSAEKFMYYMASLKGLTNSQSKAKTRELLEICSLSNVSRKKIKTFSGGMKQRLGVAQALLNNPKLLILDEPTAGLDPKERIQFRNLISELGKDRIVLLSTHIVSDVENMADTIIIMKNGEIVHNEDSENMINNIYGKVFECLTDHRTYEMLNKKYIIINARNEGNNIFLRLISDEKPTSNSKISAPTLEDLYLYYFA